LGSYKMIRVALLLRRRRAAVLDRCASACWCG
jgi:hypothetical protein